MRQPGTVLGLLAYFHHTNKYANEAETNLKLFQTVSVFCFISQCVTAIILIYEMVWKLFALSSQSSLTLSSAIGRGINEVKKTKKYPENTI